MLNGILLILVICVFAFFINLYFQLSRMEKKLIHVLNKIEAHLITLYGKRES